VTGAALTLMTAALAAAACTDGRSKTEPQAAATAVYAIAIVASTPAGLPKCTSLLAGTTAFVQSPAGLYTCQAGSWLPLPCTTALAGAVAYSSATQTLLACVSGQWSVVPLPRGATGDAGPPGPQGATGAQGERGDAGATSLVVHVPVAAGGTTCPYGGTAIESGVDDNGNHALDSAEITSISWVCNGAPGANGAAAPQIQITPEPPGANCPAGGQRIDVGAQTAYVCNGVGGVSTGGAGGSTDDAGPGGAADGGTLASCPGAPAGVPPDVVNVAGVVTAIGDPTSTGAPAAGAKVEVLDAGGNILATSTTDVEGRFSFQLPTGGAPLAIVLRASSPGFLPTYWNLAAPITGDASAAILIASSQLAGMVFADPQQGQMLVHVEDCGGAAVAGVNVNAVPAPQNVIYIGGFGQTGGSGFAVLVNLPPGEVQPSAMFRGGTFTGPTVHVIAGAVVETRVTFVASPDPQEDERQFCKEANKALCEQVFKCVPPADQETVDFFLTWGSTVETCQTNPNRQNCDAFARDCPVLNAAAARSCTTGIASRTCDELLAGAPVPSCKDVCAPPDTAAAEVQFCTDLIAVECDQMFNCVAPADRGPDFVMNWGSTIEQCKTENVPQICAAWANDCSGFNAGEAVSCRMSVASLTCTEFLGGTDVLNCDNVCAP
jgi:hypothetical protein